MESVRCSSVQVDTDLKDYCSDIEKYAGIKQIEQLSYTQLRQRLVQDSRNFLNPIWMDAQK